MQRNKVNSILFFKNVESNIIEEAVIVVKGNIKIDNENKTNELNKSILKEAELIVNTKIDENDRNILKNKLKKLNKRLTRLKVINFIMIVLYIILFLT